MPDLAVLPLLWLVVVVATLLRSFTGFGFALAAVPGLALLFTPTQAVVLSAGLSLALGVQTFPKYRNAMQLNSQWPMFVWAIPGTLLGAQLLQSLDEHTFLALIGGLVMVACVALARFQPQRRPVKPVMAGVAGLASGLVNGAFAIPGPPIIIYVMSTVSDTQASRALMMGFFGFSSSIALLTYGLAGWVGLSIIGLVVLAYPAVLLGNWLGSSLFRRYGGAFYRPVAIAGLFLLGASTLIKALV